MASVDLSIIIVNWNTRDLLEKCLASIYGAGQLPFSCETIVIDNGSTDGTAAMVSALFPQVRLQANDTNVGFTRANNQGILLCGGRYVLLLNSDAEVVAGALEAMVAYLDANPQVGVLGPQLLNSDGSIQSSRRRFPSLATGYVESTILQQYLPHLSLLSRFYCNDLPADSTQEVDWLVGACLMVRREAIDEVGILDETFFMYFEELDWCWRIKKAGWKVVFLPSAKVVHHYGKSSERDLTGRHIHFNDSKCKFYRKYFGPLAALSLRAFLLTTYAFQFAREGLKFAVGHKRPLRRERLGLLLKVLRSGLQV